MNAKKKLDQACVSHEFGLEVWGDRACFTRPEMKVERMSYPVITPSASRAIFEAVFWKPAIRWEVSRIEVLSPICWESIRRNEVGALAHPRIPYVLIEDNRQQRNTCLLKNVHYRLYAHMVYIPFAERKHFMHRHDENECLQKYEVMFVRRAHKGQCFTQPYLGNREFSACFRLLSPHFPQPQPLAEDQDFGLLFYDIDYEHPLQAPLFFHAQMKQGVIQVPPLHSKEVLR